MNKDESSQGKLSPIEAASDEAKGPPMYFASDGLTGLRRKAYSDVPK